MAYPPPPEYWRHLYMAPGEVQRIAHPLLHLMAKYAAHCNPLSLPQLRLPGQPRVRLPGEQERHARLRLLLQEHRRHGGGRHLPVPARHIRSPTSEWKIWVCSRSISTCRLGVKLWFDTRWKEICAILLDNPCCTRCTKNYFLCILAHPKESILPAPFTSPPPPLCYVTKFFLRLPKFITWLLGDCKLLLWNDPDWNLLSTQVEEDPVRSWTTTNLFLLWDLSTLDENELLSTWLLTYIDTKVLYASASVSVVSIHENQN